MNTKAEENNRIGYIDRFKGVGILLVVLGHMGVSHEWCTFITTFHMPLFFFLGGYLFNIEHYPSTKKFLIKKVKRIILPYLFFSLISLVASYCRNFFGQYDINIREVGKEFLIRGTIESNVPLWFMRSFFVVEVLFYIICKLLKKNSAIAIALLCCLFISFGFINDSSLPFARTINGLFFFGVGYIIKTREINVSVISKRLYVFSFVMLFAFQAFVTYFILQNSYIINIASINHVFIFVISAMTGIIGTFSLVMLIGENKFLEYLGRNSLIIMCTHILVKDMVSIFCTVGLEMPKKYITDLSDIKGIILTIVVVAMEIPVIEFINRFCPILVGKRKCES